MSEIAKLLRQYLDFSDSECPKPFCDDYVARAVCFAVRVSEHEDLLQKALEIAERYGKEGAAHE